MSRDDDRDPVSLKGVKKIHETASAILIRIYETPPRDIWIPKSQVVDSDFDELNGNKGTILISAWFAEKEELTDDDDI